MLIGTTNGGGYITTRWMTWLRRWMMVVVCMEEQLPHIAERESVSRLTEAVAEVEQPERAESVWCGAPANS